MVTLDHTPGRDHVEARLRDDLIVWLTSVRADGRPHIVPVWFLWNGSDLLILSKPGNQKIKNITRDPRVSLALDDSKCGHDVVILEGEATLLSEPANAIAPPAYAKKYAALLREMNWPPEAMIEEYSQAIRVRPTRFISF
ncbi:MAG: TIGR03667 family PPOX class F420-dependent oxidoreductase [Thermomicrobiales bacterium]